MKKKAEDLKPGDVIVGYADMGREFLSAISWIRPMAGGIYEICFYRLGSEERGARRSVEEHQYGTVFHVTGQELTPAQRHAEELLILARQVSAAGINPPPGSLAHIANELLARIDPPKPPSVEELAEALFEIMPKSSNMRAAMSDTVGIAPLERAKSVLERARAAGYLGRDAQ